MTAQTIEGYWSFCLGRRSALGNTNTVGAMQYLALQVREVHHVGIHRFAQTVPIPRSGQGHNATGEPSQPAPDQPTPWPLESLLLETFFHPSWWPAGEGTVRLVALQKQKKGCSTNLSWPAVFAHHHRVPQLPATVDTDQAIDDGPRRL